jgi:energy-coupling factor transporter transmembrane protein EcfT
MFKVLIWEIFFIFVIVIWLYFSFIVIEGDILKRKLSKLFKISIISFVIFLTYSYKTYQTKLLPFQTLTLECSKDSNQSFFNKYYPSNIKINLNYFSFGNFIDSGDFLNNKRFNYDVKNGFFSFSLQSQESEENRRIDHQVDFNILVDDRVTIKNVTKIMNRSMSVTFFNRGDFVDIYYTCSKKI